MKIAISAESTVDLPAEILKEFDIKTLPFHVFLGDEDGLDGEITPDKIIKFVEETGKLPKTVRFKVSLPNILGFSALGSAIR